MVPVELLHHGIAQLYTHLKRLQPFYLMMGSNWGDWWSPAGFQHDSSFLLTKTLDNHHMPVYRVTLKEREDFSVKAWLFLAGKYIPEASHQSGIVECKEPRSQGQESEL